MKGENEPDANARAAMTAAGEVDGRAYEAFGKVGVPEGGQSA
jgi:hypothetical protein